MTVVELFFLASMTVGNSSNRTLHSICGRLAIASSLVFDGRLSTLLRCSVLLSKIASLSASALSNVVAPELFGPLMFFSASEISSCLFCPQQTEFLLLSFSARNIACP